ncbi:MAG: thioesterase family protein [Myxococcales bacterium]|nr:thioesterase family protein [Myxococcales bacterium]
MTPSLDPTHHFAALADWQPDHTGALTGRIPPSWMQGRAAFGGLPAAIGLNAARRLVPPERTPRAVHAALLAPLGPAPATVTARVLRAGRALTQAEAELWQGDTLCARVTAAFGQSRPSQITVPSPTAPAMPSPETLPALPYLEGITPTFTQHFEYRFASRHLPFTGATTARLAGWVRHRTTPGAPHGALLGLLDAWPAPVMVLPKRPIPASTVTWTVSFAEVPEVIDPAAWWAFQSEAVTAADGYSTLRGALYGPDGRLAALEEQLVAVFD